MDAREVPLDELGWVIVARAALVDLVYRGNPAIGLFDLANIMGVAVTVDARGLATMNAAADSPHGASVAIAAAVFVCQRLYASLVALVRDVRMALAARDVRVSRGRIRDIVMAGKAILQGLGTGERRNKQKPETEKKFREVDPGRDRIHSPELSVRGFRPLSTIRYPNMLLRFPEVRLSGQICQPPGGPLIGAYSSAIWCRISSRRRLTPEKNPRIIITQR